MASSTKQSIKKIVIGIFLTIILVLSCVITYFPGKVFPTWSEIFRLSNLNDTADVSAYPFSVHFIDVGQADCTLIKSGNEVMLIDTGDTNSFKDIDHYLYAQNITHIDYLILTHAHADHIGSAEDVIENYPIGTIIMPKYSQKHMPTTKLYQNVLQAISKSSAQVFEAIPGNTYTLGESEFVVLAPNNDYSKMNNSSVVIKMSFKNNTFLFQGDAEKQSEEDILKAGFDVQADVLKLGHHGSDTSSAEEYIAAVHPMFAVLSCGADNQYGIPSDEILDRLERYGIQYKRTDINGDIVVASDGENLFLKTEK